MFEMTYTKSQIASLIDVRIESYEQWIAGYVEQLDECYKELASADNELIIKEIKEDIGYYEQALHDKKIALKEVKKMKEFLTN